MRSGVAHPDDDSRVMIRPHDLSPRFAGRHNSVEEIGHGGYAPDHR